MACVPAKLYLHSRSLACNPTCALQPRENRPGGFPALDSCSPLGLRLPLFSGGGRA